MARLFTRAQALANGVSDDALKWAVRSQRFMRVANGVYFEGDRAPGSFEIQVAKAMRHGKPVTAHCAAALHGFDGFNVPADGDYENIPRTNVQETLFSIAAITTDVRWEWALEWALRKRHTTIAEIEEELRKHRRGNGRVRRVLKLRPPNAPPTGSVLETMAVQLIRRHPELPTPLRQVKVRHWYVDLAWPECGVFLELDGEWHKDQPRYDATRQTGVVAATGWLVGRYTWTDIANQPISTLRSLATLFQIHARNSA